MFQDSLIADNVIVLLDNSTTYKPIDFDADPAVNRMIENNASDVDMKSLGLTGGSRFPEALVPAAGAPKIAGKAVARTLGPVAGLPVPPITERNTDIGALAAGQKPWQAGHEAWPKKP